MKSKHVFGGGTLAGVIGSVVLGATGSTGATGALSAGSISHPSGESKLESSPLSQRFLLPQKHVQTQTVKSSASVSTVGHATVAKRRTALGSSVFVNYGNVQVKVTAQGKKILDVQTVQFPHQDGQSQMIAQYSLPILRKKALVAQSAKITGVSGASYTSYGFQKSLQSALKKLGI